MDLFSFVIVYNPLSNLNKISNSLFSLGFVCHLPKGEGCLFRCWMKSHFHPRSLAGIDPSLWVGLLCKDPQELERGTMFARLLLSWVICGFITRRLFVFDVLRHRLQEPEHSIVVHVICVALGINFTKRSFLGFILWTLFTKANAAALTLQTTVYYNIRIHDYTCSK